MEFLQYTEKAKCHVGAGGPHSHRAPLWNPAGLLVFHFLALGSSQIPAKRGGADTTQGAFLLSTGEREGQGVSSSIPLVSHPGKGGAHSELLGRCDPERSEWVD